MNCQALAVDRTIRDPALIGLFVRASVDFAKHRNSSGLSSWARSFGCLIESAKTLMSERIDLPAELIELYGAFLLLLDAANRLESEAQAEEYRASVRQFEREAELVSLNSWLAP